jgi:serine/threonine-protein kinase
VPASASSLAQQADEALAQDASYVQAVSSTLSDPTGNGSSNLQTLAANTQSALVPLGNVASGAASSVSGTSNLLSWVTGAQNASKAASAPKGQTTTTVTSTTAAPGTTAPPSASSPEASDTTACGSSGVSVNAGTTSCGFAENVQSAYFADGNSGGDASVVATSPATGKTYVMTCTADGDNNVTCTGGINASLTFAG